MCVIIHKPAERELTEWTLREGLRRNSDGWGLVAYPEGRGSEPVIHRGLTGIDDFLKTYEPYAKGVETVIHFRFATHGLKDLENCHPYDVVPGVVMMHNGILSVKTPDKDLSDTGHFVQLIKPMLEEDPTMVEKEHWLKMVGELIGKGNKLVFMTKNGVFYVNKEQGSIDKDVWFSNSTLFYSTPSSYKQPPYGVTHYGYGCQIDEDDCYDLGTVSDSFRKYKRGKRGSRKPSAFTPTTPPASPKPALKPGTYTANTVPVSTYQQAQIDEKWRMFYTTSANELAARAEPMEEQYVCLWGEMMVKRPQEIYDFVYKHPWLATYMLYVMGRQELMGDKVDMAVELQLNENAEHDIYLRKQKEADEKAIEAATKIAQEATRQGIELNGCSAAQIQAQIIAGNPLTTKEDMVDGIPIIRPPQAQAPVIVL